MGSLWTATMAVALTLSALALMGQASAFTDGPLWRDCDTAEGNVYQFSQPDLEETRNISLSEYSGKPFLIVNVATYWGYTPDYLSYNVLKDQFQDSIEILGMPCTQFLNQEPGATPVEIRNGIKHVRPGGGYEPNFPLFKKLKVNGAEAHPLYQYLKATCRNPVGHDDFKSKDFYFQESFDSRDIRWNWNKFLIDQNGVPVRRYTEGHDVLSIADDIEALLNGRDLPIPCCPEAWSTYKTLSSFHGY